MCVCVCVCVCVLHVIAQAFTNYHSVKLVKARCSFRIPPKPLVIEHLLAPLYDLSDSHNMGTREEYTTGGGAMGEAHPKANRIQYDTATSWYPCSRSGLS